MIERFYSLNRLKSKLTLFLLFATFAFNKVNAQLSSIYSFSASSGTFTSIVGAPGAANVSAIQADDVATGPFSIGFNFIFAGNTYTSFYVCSNGIMTLSSSNSSAGGSGSTVPLTGVSQPTIAPLWDDLQGNVGTATYVTTGSNGSRVLTMEWLNYKWNYQATGPVISFQVKLYEGTNVIQFVYEQEATAYNAGTTSGASIGIATTGSYISVQNTSSNPTVSSTVEANQLTNKPATGQIYQFTPCSSATVTGNPSPAPTVCAGNPSTLSVTATGATSYQWQVYNGSTYSTISNNANYSGATTANLTITPTMAMNGYVYRAMVYGSCSAPTLSNASVLTVNPTPAITTQPLGTTVCEGVNVNFTTAASNTTGYQWQVSTDGGSTYNNTVDGASYSGSTTTSLTVIAPTASMNNYNYRVMATGGCTPAALSNPALMQIKAAPVVVQSPVNALVCPGGSAHYTVGATGAVLTYQWQVDPGTGTYANITNNAMYSGATTTTLNVSNIPLSMNNYNYRAMVSGACTPAAYSSSAAVNVDNLIAPAVVPLSATTFCPGGNVTLNAALDPALSYQWMYNGGNINVNGTSNTYTAADPGTYILKVTNSDGCSAFSAPTSVANLPAPVVTASASGTTTFCQGNSVSLHGSTHSGYTYYWKLNGNYISNANSSTYAAAVTGDFSIEESDGTCMTTSDPIHVTVNPLPTASIATDGSTSFCPGGSLTLHGTTDIGTTFKWYENGSLLNQSTANIDAFDAATYYVVISDNNGCTATSSTLTLSQAPAPTATVTIGGDGHSYICYNATRPLQANTGANLSYQWMYNGVAIQNATSNVYSAANAGTYGVQVTNEYGCKTTSTAVALSQDAPINPVVTQNGTTLCVNTFNAYQWYYNSTAINGATSACYNATRDGSYTVKVTDAVGCSETSAIVGINNVGVANITKNDVKIYPNPASTMVHIESPVTVNVIITGLDGRIVLQQNRAADLNISDLAAGMYMISVYTQDNTLVKTEKLVKAD